VNNILGEFGGVGNDKVFKLMKYDSVHDSEAMDLKGRRFISVSELTEEESFNEKLMKKISGGDAINLRGCASEKVNTITFDCVMWLATNDIPNFSGKNDEGVESAFAQRMRVLTFPKVFAIDSKKADDVIAHTNSFFTILCRMAKRYYDNGRIFEDVPEVLASTGKVIDNKDTFKMFWANQTEYEFVAGEKVKKTSVFSSYLGWGQGRKLLGRNGFYKRVLQEFKCVSELEAEQHKFWHGLKGSEFQ
jgi:phage/plasmid-associated DNA primase